MNKDRRKFLKIILIGSGTLLIGRVLGPLFSKFLNDSFTKTNSFAKTNPIVSTDFRIVENKNLLSVYNNSGEEIFQIDKGA
ncbi:MAG: hypothetical protein NTX96_02235 [Candidatus Zambryskibacteria bacterium]|nr:hypothetical protein [Candidatus Zambryskibacteria bacterium]